MHTYTDLYLAHPLETWTPFDIVLNSAYALLTMTVTYKPTNVVILTMWILIRSKQKNRLTVPRREFKSMIYRRRSVSHHQIHLIISYTVSTKAIRSEIHSILNKSVIWSVKMWSVYDDTEISVIKSLSHLSKRKRKKIVAEICIIQ